MDTILFYSGDKFKPANDDSRHYTKIFNWDKDKYYIDRCASEIIVRTFMERNNFDITTRTFEIEPSHLRKKLNSYDINDIQSNFCRIFEEVKEYIEQNCTNVAVNIEKAQTISSGQLAKISKSEELREEFFVRLFEILAVIHKNGIIHRDLKVENLCYVRRNGIDVIVMNDWDSSFILQNDLTDGIKNVLPMATPLYASPEQISGGKLGKHTDVWQAGMIIYYLYNNCRFPEQYNCIERENNSEIFEDIGNILEYMSVRQRTFTPPENGSDYIKKLIMLTLKINNRPTAEEILQRLKSARNDSLPPFNPLNTDECQMILNQKKEAERKKFVKRKITAVLAIAAIALAITSLTPKQSKSEIEVPNVTEATTQAVQPDDEKITQAIQQDKMNEETIQPETVQTITQDNEELNYTYTKFVENYRLDNGIYTGGLDANNQLHGHDCKFQFDNGDLYEGDYYHGKMSGEGVYTYHNGNIYTGGLKDNMRNGHGTFKLSESVNGYKGFYDGNFVNDKFQGSGNFTFDNGDLFSGEFRDDILWNGTAIYANGLVMTVENGKPIE